MGLFRIFLAVVVAYDHWRGVMLRPSGSDSLSGLFGFNAGQAVLFFYAISGFLITYTLMNNYPADADGRSRFYINRFIRIFSVYWPAALFSVWAVGGFFPLSIVDAATRIFLLGQDWSVAFESYRNAGNFSGTLQGLQQSWTLGAEMTFYLIAPIFMRNWKAGVTILVGSLLVRAAFLVVAGSVAYPTWTYYFLPSTLCFFMFGHLAGLAYKQFPILSNRNFLILAPIVLAVGPTVQSFTSLDSLNNTFESPTLWLSLLMFLVTLPALFAATKNNRIVNYLGSLSYPLYLIHSFVMIFAGGMIMQYILPFGPGATAIVFVTLALVVSVLTHEFVEKPMAAVMRVAAVRLFVPSCNDRPAE